MRQGCRGIETGSVWYRPIGTAEKNEKFSDIPAFVQVRKPSLSLSALSRNPIFIWVCARILVAWAEELNFGHCTLMLLARENNKQKAVLP